MKPTLLLAACLPLACAAIWMASAGPSEKQHKMTTVSPRKLADSLHAVIAADRQLYSEWIVQRLHSDERRIEAGTDWKEKHALPVHAQLLRGAAQRIQTQGAEFSYTLRSPWPINPSHGPQTQAEQTGMEHVRRNPGEPYYTEETLGGRSYFTAVYADTATLPSCAECHNKNPASPRRDFKPGDVMGAIVVRVPLEF